MPPGASARSLRSGSTTVVSSVAPSSSATSGQVVRLPNARPREARRSVHLTPGLILPGTRYRILRWLGEGGMGVVYEAEHVDIERHVALKILRPHLALDKSASETLRDEARAATRIGSPYIAETFDYGELSDGRVWFTMELLRGVSLISQVREKKLTLERIYAIARQVCKGLCAAHDVGIVHRDVKPENILLVEAAGRPDRVKLLDFGVSSAVARTSDPSARIGTPAFMAPEQCRGDHEYDGRLDLYALGCLLYEALVGRPPFVGNNMDEVLRKHLEVMPEPPSKVRSDGFVPKHLEAVILRCLHKDPKDRYRDARDLEAALCEAQLQDGIVTIWDDLPLPTLPAAEAERSLRISRHLPRTPAPKKKNLTTLIGAAVLASIALVWGTWTFAAPDDAARLAAAQSQVATLVAEAHEAGAMALWVYPPAEEPERPTAYLKVRELEELAGSAEREGDERAAELRTQFSETLVRLGDRYWDREGGRAFAVDYYAMSLVFDPDDARAKERALLSHGELATLRTKAETLGFLPYELEVAAPLMALAEEDLTKRVEGLRRLRERAAGPRSASGTANLLALEQSLARRPGVEVEKPPSADDVQGDTPLPDPAVVAEPVTDTARDLPLVPTPKDAAPSHRRSEVEPETPPRRSERDREDAQKLVAEAAMQQRSGQLADAERLYKRALQYDHQNTSALAGLADVTFDRAAYERSIHYGTRAAAAAPRDPAHPLRLGDAYFKLDRFQEAKAHYERARTLGSPAASRRLEKVRSHLEAIGESTEASSLPRPR